MNNAVYPVRVFYLCLRPKQRMLIIACCVFVCATFPIADELWPKYDFMYRRHIIGGKSGTFLCV